MSFKNFLVLIAIFSGTIYSCEKMKPQDEGNCIVPEIVPPQPYSYPVWHPNGNIIGFNFTPLSGISTNGRAPCNWYSYLTKSDSMGFYVMNKDGSGLKRVTNFRLIAPAWSPNGEWIAFSIGIHIYKMRYNETGFDTTNIIQLTNEGANFHPSWTSNSDSLYYDSNEATNGQGYLIKKMANNGGGKKDFLETGRQPFASNNGKIYYIRGINGQPEIFSMTQDGKDKTQVTKGGQHGNRRDPKVFGSNLFYEDNGSLRKIDELSNDIELIKPSVNYTISKNGEIVYSKMAHSITTYNKQVGTLWIMNTDGSNSRQLTFNNY